MISVWEYTQCLINKFLLTVARNRNLPRLHISFKFAVVNNCITGNLKTDGLS